MTLPTTARRMATLTALAAAAVLTLAACERRAPEPTTPATGTTTTTPAGPDSGTTTTMPGGPAASGSDSMAGSAMDPASAASR